MSDKCKNDQCPTPQECEGNNPNHKKEAKLNQRSKKSGLMTN